MWGRATRTACWSGWPCVWCCHCGDDSLGRAASIFPDGLDYVRNATGWAIQGHNRYWATNNVYALQNGGVFGTVRPDSCFAGQWQFVIENGTSYKQAIALPLECVACG